KSKNESSLGRILMRTSHSRVSRKKKVVGHLGGCYLLVITAAPACPASASRRARWTSPSKSGGGECRPRASRVSARIVAIAQSRYHLWFAGTTYHGASSVEQRVNASA